MKRCAILVLLVFLVFLVSCGEGDPEAQAQVNFKQGVRELNVKFLENAPPERIYELSNFKMILELDNQAAYDITNGDVQIIGLDDYYFFMDVYNLPFDPLLGRSLMNPAGEKTFMEFNGRAEELFQNSQNYNGNYFLKVSYDSTMEFADTICLNPDLYEVYDSGCKIEPQKSYSGQGAPLAVSEVEEILYPGNGAEVEFRLKVQNRGSGKVGAVTLNKATLGGQEIACAFQGDTVDGKTVRFGEELQERILVCRTFLRDLSSYTTTLAVDFDYSYELLQEKQLKLVDPSYNSGGFF